MVTTIFVLLLTLAARGADPQVEPANSPGVEAHIRDILRSLPPDSVLRRNLLQGARGTGVHYPWMDEMRKEGIKRVVIWVGIHFNRKGRPKQTGISRTEYFVEYEGGTPMSDNTRMEQIRASGLEKELSTLALERAKRGSWVDVPRPRPHPFIGGTRIEFLDDEWLPGADGAAGYFACSPHAPFPPCEDEQPDQQLH